MFIRLLIIITFLGASGLLFSQKDTMLKYYRNISINKNKINLQGTIQPLANVIIKDKANKYHLKKGTFEVADSIWMETNQKNQIISVNFSYNYEPEFSNDTAYIHEQRKFRKLIASKGKEFLYSSSNTQLKVTKWEDQRTTFELAELIENGKRLVFSVVFDKEYYSRYYLIDKEIENKSIILWSKLNN
jgi:hypothetical protein